MQLRTVLFSATKGDLFLNGRALNWVLEGLPSWYSLGEGARCNARRFDPKELDLLLTKAEVAAPVQLLLFLLRRLLPLAAVDIVLALLFF